MINPKERGTAGNVITMACTQNLANLLGKHIRCIGIRCTGYACYKVSFCPVLERNITNSDMMHLTSGCGRVSDA
jgi:hypothetical protein